MVSPIDPTTSTFDAIFNWKPKEDILEVSRAQMPDGTSVHYLGKCHKPGFLQFVTNWFFNLFGRGVSWKLSAVASTLLERVSVLKELDKTQLSSLKKFLAYVDEINKQHKGKVSEEVIKTLRNLCLEKSQSQVPVSKPLSSTPKEETPLSLQKGEGERQMLGKVHRPRGPAQRNPPTSHHASSSSPQQEAPAMPPPKKPIGGIGLGVLPGMDEAIKRRQQGLGEKK